MPTQKMALQNYDDNRLSPLANIAKSKTAPFRIFHMGTSIGDATVAAGKMLAEQMKFVYGDTGMVEMRAGIMGGSYESVQFGWEKQPYGGPMFTRLRGKSTSSALTFYNYFDSMVIEWSQETDGAASAVLIDGVASGSYGQAGAQKYSNRTTFNTTLGWHTVTINPPAAGFNYLETIEFRNTTRTGVELRTASLGGSSLSQMVTLRTPVAPQVAGIPIEPNVGIDSFIDRSDVDLFSISYTVNDAGSGMAWVTGGFKTSIDRMVSIAGARGIPMIILIEMGGHYSMPNDGGNSNYNTQFNIVRDHLLSLAKNNHVTVLDWHAATILSDLAAYAARYYLTVANLNVGAGTYTGDFIHPNTAGHQASHSLIFKAAGMTPPAFSEPNQIKWERFRTLPEGLGRDQVAVLAGVTKRYAQPSGVAIDPISTDQGRRVGYYRDATAPVHAANTTVANAVAAAGTSDKYGPYVDWTNFNIGTGFTPDWAAGKRLRFTFRMNPKTEGGSIDIRVGGSAKVYVDGVAITGNILFQNVTMGVPLVVSVDIGAPAASQYLSVSGRVYEMGAFESTVPLLPA